MKKKVLLGVVTLLSVALILSFMVVIVSNHGATARAFDPTPIPSVAAPVETDPVFSPSAGVPAITHAGGGPPTSADVKAFVQKHGFAGGKTASGAAPTILAVTLMSAKQAKGLLSGESTDRPDTAMVFYVQLQGPFVLRIPTPPGVGPITVQKGEELFDATTGNLILFGSSG